MYFILQYIRNQCKYGFCHCFTVKHIYFTYLADIVGRERNVFLMSKLLKNGKQIFAFVVAFAIIAVSLFTSSINMDADALCSGTKVVYWNGTQSSSFSKGNGTKDNPYIIETAEQLNYVCVVSNTASNGKYYKVDPTIKAFILQPESVVTTLGGNEVFLGVKTAQDMKTLFETTAKNADVTLKNWLETGGCNIFAGNFDGSNAVICGLYADDAKRGTQQCGLFPILDATDKEGEYTTVANFILKNSYFKGLRRLGAVASTTWYDKSGTCNNNNVKVQNLEVANCYLVGQDLNETNNTIHAWNESNRLSEMAVLSGSPGNDPIILNMCSVHGNVTEYRTYGTAENTNPDITENAFDTIIKGNNSETLFGEYHNVVALGASIANINNNTDKRTYSTNTYSDKTSNRDCVKIESGYGAAGRIAMTKFDWENVWFMSEDGPTLRSLHSEIVLVKDDHSVHYYACKDCGLKGEDGAVAHSWSGTDGNVCSVCGYICNHNKDGDQVIENVTEATCVTKMGTYTYCKNCNWKQEDTYGTVSGHNLEWIPEVDSDCTNTGIKGYWHCKTCNRNFTADSEEAAKWAADNTSVDPAKDLIIPKKEFHSANDGDDHVLVYYDEEGHWYKCYVCDGRLQYEQGDIVEDNVKAKHKFEKGVCKECGYECKEHDYKPTGIVSAVGSCTVDRQEEYKCTKCGNKISVVTEKAGHKIVKVDEVAATDKLEGTKAHYKCTVCHEIYTDAEGKTKALQADLVIPKTLPAGYENQIIGSNGTLNTDNSSKSPSTRDNVAVAIVVSAVLAGGVFGVIRKLTKA